MPYVQRPDGARIYYEVRGAGFPLLLIAPGGVNSQVSFWPRSPINALTFVDEFMVIAMDQRNAEHSPAPLAAPSWADHAGDLLAVLDAAGARRAHVWGGCIGVAYVLRLLREAPERVVAAVCQNPVGLAAGVNDRSTFFAMFKPTIETARAEGMAAVVTAALENPLFVENNRAGPFAARIAADPEFRSQVLALEPAEYERIIRAYDENIWGLHAPYISVEESFVRQIRQPLLVLPGSDPFHPTPVAERLVAEAPNAAGLDVAWRSPERVEDTAGRVRAFLRAHRPATW